MKTKVVWVIVILYFRLTSSVIDNGFEIFITTIIHLKMCDMRNYVWEDLRMA